MKISTSRLLAFLLDNAYLDVNHQIIEIAVAAEGHQGVDGKFIADISSMERP